MKQREVGLELPHVAKNKVIGAPPIAKRLGKYIEAMRGHVCKAQID